MAVPRAAISEADLASFIPLHPQLQQEVEQPEPEERLFNHIVSDNVLIRPKNLSESATSFGIVCRSRGDGFISFACNQIDHHRRNYNEDLRYYWYVC